MIGTLFTPTIKDIKGKKCIQNLRKWKKKIETLKNIIRRKKNYQDFTLYIWNKLKIINCIMLDTICTVTVKIGYFVYM